MGLKDSYELCPLSGTHYDLWSVGNVLFKYHYLIKSTQFTNLNLKKKSLLYKLTLRKHLKPCLKHPLSKVPIRHS